RINKERLELILRNVPKDFLSDEELNLLVYILLINEKAIAFEDSERGRFKSKYFPDYIMQTVDHVPWEYPQHPYPLAKKAEMIRLLREQVKAGNLEIAEGPYRSRIFAIEKPNGK
ncbi:hypothetical protein DL93DRAFT_2043946, partial [Clavulina sp. PMI_390]